MRRSLRSNVEGLSTTEYVILLLVVACIGIAAWRIFGTTAYQRATSASGDVSQLGQTVDGPGGGSGGGGAGGGGSGASGGHARSHLDEATADATPPPDPKDELTMPFALLAGAALLLLAMVARRMKGGDGAKGGAKGSK